VVETVVPGQQHESPRKWGIRAWVEVPIPHTNSPLLPIAPFTVPKRVRDKLDTARREILEAIDDLCASGGAEFRLDALMDILNPDNDVQRRWTVEKAVSRMHRGDHGWPAEIVRARPGVYRKL
jgi:hypothetical protein